MYGTRVSSRYATKALPSECSGAMTSLPWDARLMQKVAYPPVDPPSPCEKSATGSGPGRTGGARVAGSGCCERVVRIGRRIGCRRAGSARKERMFWDWSFVNGWFGSHGTPVGDGVAVG